MPAWLRRASYAFIISLLLLAACRAQVEADSVTFMVSGDPAELAAYQTLVQRFSEEHPGIEVSLTYVASRKEYREKLATMFSARQPPDVFLYNYRRLGDYAAAGAVQPLGDLLDDSAVLESTAFYPATLDAFTYQGELQCIPQNISSPVIFYNKSLFDLSGLPYPASDWTAEEFLFLAEALTADLDGDGELDQWGFGTEVATIRLAPFIWSNGGSFFDQPRRPNALALSSSESKAAIEWFIDLQLKHKVVPNLEAETAMPSELRFLNGSLAMLMDSRVGVPALRTISSFAWDAAPLPLGSQFISVLHSDGFCLSASAGGRDPLATQAWRFIEFAVSERGQKILAETGRIVPSMVRVATSVAFLASSPPANNQVWLDAAADLRALPMLPGWNTFEELFSKELQRAFYGDTTLDELLVKAESLAEGLLIP